MEAPPAYRASELPSPSTHWDTISTVEVRRNSPMGGRQHKSGGHDSSSQLPPQGPKSKARQPGGNYINSTHPQEIKMLLRFGIQNLPYRTLKKNTLKTCFQKPNSGPPKHDPQTPPFAIHGVPFNPRPKPEAERPTRGR